MRNSNLAYTFAALAAMTVVATAGMADVRAQDGKDSVKPEMKPDVAALLTESTDVYKKMRSYRHTARWSISVKGQDGEAHEDLNFTLALERPNRFVYKLDSKSQFFPPVAAYCDGSTFINFKARLVPTPSRQYTKVKAPATFKGINIVDDVEFQPIATYVIALMLQGNALADKDVRAAMEKASMKPSVTENGKTWQVLEMPFGQDALPITLYFGKDDHLIGKAIQKPTKTVNTQITEMVDAVKIDKPVEASAFQYALPPDARLVERFTAPQRPGDASVSRPLSPIARR